METRSVEEIKRKAEEIKKSASVNASGLKVNQGQILKDLRYVLGIWQKDIADKLGLTASAISQAETKECQNKDFLKRYLSVLGLSENDFNAIEYGYSMIRAKFIGELFAPDFQKRLQSGQKLASKVITQKITSKLTDLSSELTQRELLAVLESAVMIQRSKLFKNMSLSKQDLSLLEELL